MTTPALEITGLRKTYGQKIAVDDLSLRVAEGEVFGILGPNGAGKTVLLVQHPFEVDRVVERLVEMRPR